METPETIQGKGYLMSEVQVFNHELFGSQVVRQDERGNPVFILSTVAKALGYRDAEKAQRVLDRDEYWSEVADLPTPQGGTSLVRRRALMISESGMYHLAFASARPEAKVFRRWVTEEVLPTLRKAHEVGIDAITELQERVHELESNQEFMHAQVECMNQADGLRIQDIRDSYDDGVRRGIKIGLSMPRVPSGHWQQG